MLGPMKIKLNVQASTIIIIIIIIIIIRN